MTEEEEKQYKGFSSDFVDSVYDSLNISGTKNLADTEEVSDTSDVMLVGYDGSDVVRVPAYAVGGSGGASSAEVSKLRSDINTLSTSLDNEVADRMQKDSEAQIRISALEQKSPNVEAGTGILITPTSPDTPGMGSLRISADGTVMRKLEDTPAGDYGDETHVTQIQVGADGQITKIRSIRIPGATAERDGLMSASDKAKIDRYKEEISYDELMEILTD